MTNSRAVNEIAKLNITQKKNLLGVLLNSLVADIDSVDRKELLHTVFLKDKETKPVIEMVEY